MSDSFVISIQSLRESSSEFRQLGQQLSDGQGTLKSQVAGGPDVWGADEEGMAFGGAYQEVAAKMGELLGALAEAFDTVGHNLNVHADNVDAADEAVKKRLAEIERGIGGRA
ncbi:WXG100 family type VII secretion target [Actinomadura algeriensis]|uniref:Uncharacterized protein YukE n=1 Tax=Actinomadura algeriensis TaxID=1679523 RepID=A0ABR9JJ87_9ACTN|nr:hypothetical protein [Actinomadura algeriensis]MBE1530620.1 uncharacterized protein YukE [Actinomadura algeriensis]